MKKLKQALLPVVQGFLLCAVVLQIILGVMYIGKNFMAVPQFHDTAIYLEIAEQLVTDEYTGILYPLLIKLCKAISFIPYQIPIYIIQIVARVYGVYRFAYTWIGRKIPAFVCALWINTIPFVAQAHVSVLPHSLALTCLIFMSLQVLKGSVKRRTLTITEWAGLLCSFVFLAQLDRIYVLPGMLFLLWGAVLQFYNRTHRVLLFVVSLFISVGMLIVNVAIFHVTQNPGHYGRIQRTTASAFFQRTGVITLKDKYQIYMPLEVQDSYTGEDLNYISNYPYKIKYEFGPALEARLGQKRANEIYVELGMLGLTEATRENTINIAQDVIRYAVPLGGYASWQNGELQGATGWNYQQFISEAPMLSVCYARISIFSWGFLLGLSLTVYILKALKHRKWHIGIWLPAVGCILLYSVYFAMSGTDVYDYKLALLSMVVSYAPICCWAFQYIFKEV